MEPIVNKVADSGIITLDLARFIPQESELMIFDLKPFLFREMILREKDYRTGLQEHDWEQYKNKQVAITCSVDAIIPMWAFMLAATHLQPVCGDVYFGTADDVKRQIILKGIAAINLADYTDKRVVLKGCGDIAIPEYAYVEASKNLRPVVKSLMYGEPCSTVPIYKKQGVRSAPLND